MIANPGEGLRVELFWNPPESPSDGSDVDLHLLHPTAPSWFHMTGDCYYSNCNSSEGMVLDWDAPPLDDNHFPVFGNPVKQCGELLAGAGVSEFNGHKKLQSVQEYCTAKRLECQDTIFSLAIFAVQRNNA